MHQHSSNTAGSNIEKGTKIILLFVLFFILTTAAFTYYKYYINEDYAITFEGDCDPSEASCFVYHCDADFEECTGNPEEDVTYFKFVTKKALELPLCDPSEEACMASLCVETSDCEIELCNPETSGQECSVPDGSSSADDEEAEPAPDEEVEKDIGEKNIGE